MVNTGKPSKACFACRTRRIKCDAARPACVKCIKHGVECPGYPVKPGFTFRDDTSKVQERAAKKYAQTARAHENPTTSGIRSRVTRDEKASSSSESLKSIRAGALESTTHTLSLKDTGNAPRIKLSICRLPSSSYSLTQSAVNLFISQWSTPDPEKFWGAFDGAALLYPTAYLSPCFTAALEAVSLITVSLSNKDYNTDFRRPAMKAYGRSLLLINKALEEESQRRIIDHTFMAIELVILFELLESSLQSEFVGPTYGTRPEHTSGVERCLAHLKGIMAVVSMRGREQFSSSLGRRLFLTAYLLWNIGSISMPVPIRVPLPQHVWSDLFAYDMGTYNDTYRLLPIQDSAVAVRIEASQLLNASDASSSADQEKTEAFLHRVKAVDNDLFHWHESLYAGWAERVDMYAVFTINLYRSYRIFVQDLLLRCYRHLASLDFNDYQDEIAETLNTSHILLDSTCASMPYEFARDEPKERQEVPTAQIPKQGMTIVFHLMFSFPLLVASMVAPVSDKQREGIQEARMECARACGLSRPIRQYPRTLLKESSATT